MKKAYSALHVKAISEDGEFVHIEGIASSPKTDRDGDIVLPMGAQFQTPMPLLLQHKHDQPVGQVYFAAPNSKGIPFKAKLPIIKEAGKLKDRVDEAIHSLKHKLLGFVSIGFSPIEGEFKRLDSGGYEFKKWNWHELSIVTIPAQPDAVISMVKSISEDEDPEQLSLAAVTMLKSYDGETPAASGKKDFVVARLNPTAGASASNKKTFDKPKPLEGRDMKNIQDQIKSFQDSRSALAEKMSALMEKAAEEGRGLDQSESEEFENMEREVQATDDQLKRLATMEKLNMHKAAPIVDRSPDAGRDRVPAVAKNTEKLEPGIEFARYAMCKLAGQNNPMMALEAAKAHYGHNPRIIHALEFEAKGGKMGNVMKATVEAGTTLDTTWAAPLVEYQNFAGDFVEYLRNRSIIGQFGQGNVPSLNRIPFNVRIAGQTSGGNASWVGEGAPKPLTSFDFNATELRWSKVAAIAVLTNELIRFSNPSAERLVRDGLAGAVIERIDVDFISPTKAAVANVSPASITNGATAVASSGSDADAIRADIQALWAPFIAARNAPRNAVYIMDSTTALALSMMLNPLGQSEFPGLSMNGGTFMGVPVVVSDYLPADSSGGIVVLVNASDIWLADDGQVTIDTSREASLQMLDNPTNNSATGTATAMVSMFQTNSTAFLCERYINWARRRASGVAYLTGVSWGA